MDPRQLSTTRLEDVLALGAGGRSLLHSHTQLSRYLERVLTPLHARLLAEPEVDEQRGIADWYTVAAGEPRKLMDLPEEQKAIQFSRLSRLLQDIGDHATSLENSESITDREHAAALQQIVQVPSVDHVYFVGDQPVLTCWGHLAAGASPPRDVLLSLLAPYRQPASSDASQPEGATTPQSLVDTPVQETEPLTEDSATAASAIPIAAGSEAYFVERRGFDWIAALIAVLLVLVGLAIVFVLLRACAIGWPAQRAPDWLSFCPNVEKAMPSEPPQDLVLALQRQRQLEMEIADLRVEMALERGRCSVPEPVVVPPPPSPDPTPEPRTDVPEQVGQPGAFEVTLWWDGPADLDLAVTCPNRKVISYRNKRDCQGELDVDANASGIRSNPAEHVTWIDGNAPEGSYEIRVNLFKRRNDARRPLPFRVRVTKKLPDGTLVYDEVYDSSFNGRSPWVDVATFTVP